MDRFILWQRAEGLLLFAAGLSLFAAYPDGMPWWAALLWFFAPDLSFVGYGLGPRVGAMLYNAVHVYGAGAALLAIGVLAPAPLVAAVGALFLSHAGFDRMLGYGLKSPESFSITHLGRIGKKP